MQLFVRDAPDDLMHKVRVRAAEHGIPQREWILKVLAKELGHELSPQETRVSSAQAQKRQATSKVSVRGR
jgi:plasmid stability protein